MSVGMDEGCGWLDTVLVAAPPGPTVAAIVVVAAQMRLNVVPVACLEDLIALPAYLVVVDPTMLTDDEWSEWCRWLRDAEGAGQRVLPIGPARHREGVPEANLTSLPQPLGLPELAQLLASLRRAAASSQTEPSHIEAARRQQDKGEPREHH